MPDTPSTTLTHLFADGRLLTSACGLDMLDEKSTGGGGTVHTGQVTCFACRRSRPFYLAQQLQGVGASTPLPQRVAPPPLTPPVKLSGVMAEHPLFISLREKLAAEGAHTYRITVDVICASLEEAEQVAAERLGPDEDYGFEYQFTPHTVTPLN